MKPRERMRCSRRTLGRSRTAWIAFSDVDVQFLNHLRAVVHVQASQAEAVVDDLLPSVGLGIGLRH